MGSRFLLSVIMAIVLLLFAAGEGEVNIVFYMHDNLTGSNVTAVPVAGLNGSRSNAGKFGTIVTISDVVTRRPEITESDTDNVIGRAQGTYVNTNPVTGLEFLMVFTLIFQDMEYSGSTLEIHGTDRFALPRREFAVVGGTGKFRFARGYAVANTQYLVANTQYLSGANSVIKFNTTIRTD